jgi:hypothetical protein
MGTHSTRSQQLALTDCLIPLILRCLMSSKVWKGRQYSHLTKRSHSLFSAAHTSPTLSLQSFRHTTTPHCIAVSQRSHSILLIPIVLSTSIFCSVMLSSLTSSRTQLYLPLSNEPPPIIYSSPTTQAANTSCVLSPAISQQPSGDVPSSLLSPGGQGNPVKRTTKVPWMQRSPIFKHPQPFTSPA